MSEIRITGASDDLIEIEGDIREEFYYEDLEQGQYLGFSDGTVLKVQYDDDGIWRFTPKVIGCGTEYSKVEGMAHKDTFDIVNHQ